MTVSEAKGGFGLSQGLIWEAAGAPPQLCGASFCGAGCLLQGVMVSRISAKAHLPVQVWTSV